MKKTPVVLTSILILIGSVLGAAVLSMPAHASSAGVVCIIPSGATSCPSTPASIDGTVGSQIRVSVFIQNSSGIDGFDITLLADHAVLKPAGFDLTGSVLVSPPTVLVFCESGVLIQGNSCSSTDTIDTLHLTAVSAVGSPLTGTPTTGLLFTAIYNVTGTTSGTPIGFQTGCSSTSVSPNVCVTIANGTPTSVLETVQTAIFSTSRTPDFLISANPTSLTIPAGSSANSTITLTSVNGLSGTVALTTLAPPLCSQPGCSSWSLSPTSVSLSPGGSGTSTLSIFAGTAFPGPGKSFTLTVNGTINGITHAVNVVFTTIAPDFSISASPSSLTIVQGSSGTSTITVEALNGFSGTVSLTVGHSSGIGAIISPTSITGSGTATLTIGTNSSGTFSVTVTGTSGSLSHSTVVTVTVTPQTMPDFSLSASPSSITFAPGTSGTSTISVTALNGFSGTVSLTLTPSPGIAATITPTSVAGSGSATLTVTGSAVGTFSVQVTGVSGSITHSANVTVTITGSAGVVCIVQSGSTSCAGPASLTGAVGTQLRVSIFIQGSGGLDGFDVTLLADHTILRPSGIDLTGTVLLGTPVILVECVGGVLVQGSTCSTRDTVDTVELAATSALGSGDTVAPTTGLLFTAIYNVTGTSSDTPLTFQTGCSNTSGFGGVCVTITNGSVAPVPETVETTVFINSGPMPDFSIAVSPSNLTVARGSCDASSTVTLTSIGSFSGAISLTTTVPAGITATLSSSSVTLSPGGTATIPLTVCIAALTSPGSYTITITATSGSIIHTATMSVIVPSQDFHISPIPSALTIRRGSTNSSLAVSILTVTSIGFSGTVSISTAITPKAPHGPTLTLSSASLTLSSGGTAQVFLTVAAGKNTSVGSYTVTVTFTSGSITQTATIAVVVVK